MNVPVASARDARHGLNFKTANRSSRRRRRRRARRAALHRSSGDGARASLRQGRRRGAHRASVEERRSSARARSVVRRPIDVIDGCIHIQTLFYNTLSFLTVSMEVVFASLRFSFYMPYPFNILHRRVLQFLHRYFLDKVPMSRRDSEKDPLHVQVSLVSPRARTPTHARARTPTRPVTRRVTRTRTPRACRLRSDVKGIGIDADDGWNVCASDVGGVHVDVDTRVDDAVRRGPIARAERTVGRAR